MSSAYPCAIGDPARCGNYDGEGGCTAMKGEPCGFDDTVEPTPPEPPMGTAIKYPEWVEAALSAE